MRYISDISVFVLAAVIPMAAANMDAFAQSSNSTKTSSSNTAFADNDLIVKGKGFSITQSEIDDIYIRYSTSIAMSGQTIPTKMVEKIEKEMLEQLILRKIVLQKVTDEDKQESAKRSQKELDRLLKNAGGENKLRRQVMAEGWKSYDEYVSNLKEVYLCNAYMERTIKVEVTSEDAKKYYEDNKKVFDVANEMFMGGFIFFSKTDTLSGEPLKLDEWNTKKELAAKVLKKIRDGQDFEEMMKQYSDDFRSRNRGATCVLIRGQMSDTFDQAAFALKDGEVSNLIETDTGIFIVKVVKRTEKGLIPFEEVEKKIIEELQAKRRIEKVVNQISSEWKKEFNVEYLTH